jgi:D-alanine-D-alanine ligase
VKTAVLLGGTTADPQVSLASGRGIVKGLKARGHEVTAIDAATAEVLSGERLETMARISAEPPAPFHGSRRGLATCRPLLEADLAFISVHGGEGEDGTLQAFFDLMDIPYTGSGTRACALTWDKQATRLYLRDGGIPVADGFLVVDGRPGRGPDVARIGARIEKEIGYPVIVKPNAEGSTIGVTKLESGAGLAEALGKARGRSGDVLIERYIPGHELTVAVFDGEAFPVTEIVADTGFYDYESKYQKGHTRYITPAEIPAEVAREVQRLSSEAFRLFGCEGVARIDFRMQPDGALFCLEINSVPGMTELSLVPMGAMALGIDYPELVDRMAQAALRTRGRHA